MGCLRRFFYDTRYFWIGCTQFPPCNYDVPRLVRLLYSAEMAYYLQVRPDQPIRCFAADGALLHLYQHFTAFELGKCELTPSCAQLPCVRVLGAVSLAEG